MRRVFAFLLVAGSVFGPSLGAAPQGQCRAPQPTPSKEPNIFSAAQENDLGDAIAERFEGSLRILEDDALTANLRRMGERLVSHLPPTDLKIQFRLIDIPDANAFVLPGGRIYVSRKLIGLTRTEDELAGVLGHELGHLVARQVTIAVTRQLKEVLNVTSLGDRQDVLTKYNKLMDNAARKPGVFRGASHEGADQIEADRLGLFIVAAAGYDASAHATFFDRFAETEGDTGGFFSRLLGTANPDSKRLRELLKTTATLPAGCKPDAAAASGTAYHQWQLAVAAASPTSGTESLPGLIKQTPLAPLRDQIEHVRFSPDGKYLLAQDDSSISVLDRDPLAVRFRITTNEAAPAEFTPDSQSVVFHRNDLRVERWSVADKALVDVNDLYWKSECLTTALAPDGKTIGCVDEDGHLTVIDVASGRMVYQKKSFYRLTIYDILSRAANRSANGQLAGLTLEFSPSGKYLVAGYSAYLDTSVVVYDVPQKVAVNLKDQARKLLGGNFTFVSGDRLVGINKQDPKKSGIVSLPGGQVEEVALPVLARSVLSRPAQANQVIISPVEKSFAGLFDLEKKAIVATFTRQVDVFGDTYASERGAGDVGLFTVADNKLQKSLVLPTPLLWLRLAAVSPDLRYLAASGSTRSNVWDTTKGERLGSMSDFFGAFVDERGSVVADPATGNWQRSLMLFDSAARRFTQGVRIAADHAAQYGQWLLVARPLEGDMNSYGAVYQLRDVRKTDVALWVKPFEKEAPHDYWFDGQSDSLAFVWMADSPPGRVKIRQDEVLKKSVDLGDVKGDYVVDLIDPRSGDLRKRMLLETGKGSFRVHGLTVRGDTMFVTDSIGRVVTYTVSTGDLRGHAFGETPAASADGKSLAVDVGQGRVALYDTDTMTRRSDLRFKQPVVYKTFSADGATLMAVTADQTAHWIKVR